MVVRQQRIGGDIPGERGRFRPLDPIFQIDDRQFGEHGLRRAGPATKEVFEPRLTPLPSLLERLEERLGGRIDEGAGVAIGG